MKPSQRILRLILAAGLAALAARSLAQTAPDAPAANPYKVLSTTKLPPSPGGIDYVFADSDGRRLYIPKSTQTLVFNLDTLVQVGTITTSSVHGATVDPKSHHGFSSSQPVVMWDSETLKTIKTIPMDGQPDGILFDPGTEQVLILSHNAPNVTVIDAKDGSVVGTIDLGGAPEQGASDGKGKVYIDLEDKDAVAVVDMKERKLLATYDLGGKAGGVAGLAMDVKNNILFSFGRSPQACAILSATDGKILAALPIGMGTDGGTFNPDTMEAFSSQGDGTMTIIKENSPTDFVVEQNVKTMNRAKTLTIDQKTGHIILITTEAAPAAAAAMPGQTATMSGATPPATPVVTPGPTPAGSGQGPGAPGGPGRGRGRGNRGPNILDIIVVGH